MVIDTENDNIKKSRKCEGPCSLPNTHTIYICMFYVCLIPKNTKKTTFKRKFFFPFESKGGLMLSTPSGATLLHVFISMCPNVEKRFLLHVTCDSPFLKVTVTGGAESGWLCCLLPRGMSIYHPERGVWWHGLLNLYIRKQYWQYYRILRSFDINAERWIHRTGTFLWIHCWTLGILPKYLTSVSSVCK